MWCTPAAEALRETRDGVARRLRPAAAAEDHHRAARSGDKLAEPRHLGVAGRGLHRREGRRIVHGNALGQHVLGQADTTGPGRPFVAVWKARETSSGTRAGSSISVAHLVIEPNTAR